MERSLGPVPAVPFARAVLLADALFCAAVGAAAVAARGWLSANVAIPAGAIAIIGLALVVYAVDLVLVAQNARRVRPFLALVVAGNVAWIAASAVYTGLRGDSMTGAGIAVVATIGLGAATIMAAQWRALRKSS